MDDGKVEPLETEDDSQRWGLSSGVFTNLETQFVNDFGPPHHSKPSTPPASFPVSDRRAQYARALDPPHNQPSSSYSLTRRINAEYPSSEGANNEGLSHHDKKEASSTSSLPSYDQHYKDPIVVLDAGRQTRKNYRRQIQLTRGHQKQPKSSRKSKSSNLILPEIKRGRFSQWAKKFYTCSSSDDYFSDNAHKSPQAASKSSFISKSNDIIIFFSTTTFTTMAHQDRMCGDGSPGYPPDMYRSPPLSDVFVLPVPEDASMAHHVNYTPSTVSLSRTQRSLSSGLTSPSSASTSSDSGHPLLSTYPQPGVLTRAASYVASCIPAPVADYLPLPNINPWNPTTNMNTQPNPGPFRNPWPSWRNAGMNDAYEAFQRGATLMQRPAEGEEEDMQRNGRWVQVRKPEWRRQAVGGKSSGKQGKQVEKQREQICWLGHAGVMVRLPYPESDPTQTSTQKDGSDDDEADDSMVGIIFDPIFSQRCSPSQYIGPSRYIPPPCSISDLPPVHICCISHDHYDHLDYYTIMDLFHLNGSGIHFFVPLGVKQWFVDCGIPNVQVTELDWHQEAVITVPRGPGRRENQEWTEWNDAQSEDATEERIAKSPRLSSDSEEVTPGLPLTLKVICTPAQHRSGRSLMSQMNTLWSSWVVGVIGDETRQRSLRDAVQDGHAKIQESYKYPAPGLDQEHLRHEDDASFGPGDGFRMFFGGDTGYRYAGAPEADLEKAICPAFQEISDRYGPMDISFLPISTGSSLSFLRTLLGISLYHYALTSSQHSNAWDAIQLGKIMNSKACVAIHHSTFSPEDESRGCVSEFDATRRSEGVSGKWGEKGCFIVADVGEVLDMGDFDA